VWYRFVMELGCVPLNGSSSAQHIAADLAAVDWAQPLSAQEMRDIGALIGEEVPGQAS
jgi:diketogulonate reductase-like aldo/keto reductase